MLLICSLTDNFELTSPKNVVGIVGQDTILPCTISSTKPLDNPKVQWKKITDGHTEDIYIYGQFGGEPRQKYPGRTSVPGDGFATGNVSLTLKNVQPADEGIYSCIVISRDWSADTATKLSIAGGRDSLGWVGEGESAEGKGSVIRACVFCSSWPDLIIAEFVTLDSDTAHPRLEVSADGSRVKDTGVIRFLLSNEKRFDSHLFVLAEKGYTTGKHYWEVNVGTRTNWAVGIALESVTRKGTLTLTPQNGFWIIMCADGQDYWAYTNPWTCLTVTGSLSKIGIFLDIPAKQVSFYNVSKRAALYTFSIANGSSQEGKFIPLFSTGLAVAEPDTEALEIVQFSDDYDDDECLPMKGGISLGVVDMTPPPFPLNYYSFENHRLQARIWVKGKYSFY
uniref:Uncharacterized protein n=1 Tax=Malurus cyaneus samueli TaxID=2593467 RepID=A0A8C5X994_9PASS